ncbi:ladderlectin-like [Centroberyx gerrardi]
MAQMYPELFTECVVTRAMSKDVSNSLVPPEQEQELNPYQRLMHWCLLLQAHELDVCHIRGKENVYSVTAKKSDPSCALGWSPYGSRCFIFNNNPVNWVQAEQHCLTLGANLASVHSLEEYEFIQEMVKGSSGGLPETWIGGSDNAQDRTWFWSDGSSFDYQHWNSGEPNNLGGRQPCIEMNYGGEKGWNDWTCESEFTSVCAKRLNC